MFKEFLEDAGDFFEDIYESLFEQNEKNKKSGTALLARTKHAYHFTERVDSLMKVVFGASIFISATAASVWGFASIGDLVKAFVDSWPGRIALVFLGTSYLINGTWRFFHLKN